MAKPKLLFKTRLLKGLLLAVALIPKPAAWGLSTLGAKIMLRLDARSACTTDENLRLAQPDLTDAQRRQLTVDSLSHTLFMAFELAKVWTQPWSKLAQTIAIKPESQALLDQVIDQQAGVVFLAPHIGNWELLGFYLQQQTPLTVLYQPGPSAAVNQLMLDRRESYGTKILPTNRQGVMGLFKSLKQGGSTGVLPDQVPEKAGGEFAPFFGVQAFTMTLIHNLIQRTGCRVVIAACLRNAAGFEIVIQEPVADIYADNLEQSLSGLNQSIEQLVLSAPEQYQWEYKRYRRLLPGEPKRYVKKKI
ncbi:lysophospholipid acyltransferase family protein [Simiduia curdlanivorans]|uniref:Lysophospholipid acyltransferase family protein n=1 Tax=Simiduia curdlanivorans TaxID=1492769 RepID=A0ABV8UZV2_9GAMM|nr:lysophospholipid acyltransferase family protein [Simiduia curdlanivorans]MDN3638009.1 lysophospholipid acyltransferase family protein [Simiduia curdlanivorans]